jgi:hypothetical protein
MYGNGVQTGTERIIIVIAHQLILSGRPLVQVVFGVVVVVTTTTTIAAPGFDTSTLPATATATLAFD